MERSKRPNELECLNSIKNSFLNCSDLKKEFDNSDYLTMKSILISATHSPNHNEFPDFFFNGGIIEHFEVTASKQKKGGAQYSIENADFRRKALKHFEQLDDKFISGPRHPGMVAVGTAENIYDDFSYEYFISSFKKNSEHHLNSLHKSTYSNQIVVFLIEMKAGSLCVYINNRFNRFYKLSEDKNLLQYIKKTFVNVDYIIFNASDRYEIIDLSKIDQLIEKAQNGLDIKGGRQNDFVFNIYLDEFLP